MPVLDRFSTTHLRGMRVTLRCDVRFATQSVIHYVSSGLPESTMHRSFVDPISVYGIREKPGTVPA